MYDNFEIEKMLKSIVILIDTREQDTPAFRRRLEGFNCPSERYKLSFGDYSAKVLNPHGEWLYFDDKVAVERKMNIDELCQCFTKGRDRFQREFERAQKKKAHIHLLVENGDWDKAISGMYRSKLNPNSLIASTIAWSLRYNYKTYFVTDKESPTLIKKILYYEVKNILESEAS